MAVEEDSTGKTKVARARSAWFSVAFILGICAGMVVAERWYLANQEESKTARSSGLQGSRSRKLELGVAGSAASGARGSGGLFSVKGRPRNELDKLLRKVAPKGEVMIAISNMNLIREGSLTMWLECASRIPSKNWLVVAIDEELRDYCKEHGINHYYRPVEIPASQANTGNNHAISSMKYEIIEEFLALGWNVMLSDVDVVIVQDPFEHLYRDSDVESMSDGFDNATAYGEIYGVDDESMGWSRYAQGARHMVFNSGLFYVQASERTVALMRRVAARLRVEKAWDQSVFNEEIFFLSHGEYKSPQVSTRAMELELFMNSKVLFKRVRHLPAAEQRRPVMVHMNYHPDKSERMRAVIKHYLEGEADALMAFPGGSEKGS